MKLEFPDKGTGYAGELLVAQTAGAFYHRNVAGNVFTANVTAVTITAIAATLVSVYSLYNPRNSGIDMELIDADLTTALATTVVNTYGLYFSADKNADTATFTTKGTAQPGKIDGGPAGNKGQFYSALTHVGTPVRWRVIGGHFGGYVNRRRNDFRHGHRRDMGRNPGLSGSDHMRTAP